MCPAVKATSLSRASSLLRSSSSSESETSRAAPWSAPARTQQRASLLYALLCQCIPGTFLCKQREESKSETGGKTRHLNTRRVGPNSVQRLNINETRDTPARAALTSALPALPELVTHKVVTGAPKVITH